MQALRTLPLVLGATALLAAGVVALRSTNRQDASGLPALPESPIQAYELLELVPFTLEQPATHYFRLEQPSYDAGFLVALRVDESVAGVREGYEPVLCAGEQTLARQNLGGPERSVIAILPAPRGADGLPVIDWSSTPIWHASPELPERVDTAWLAAELQAAYAAGVVAPRAEAVAAALGPAPLHVPSRVDLNPALADLIERHSPGEIDVIRGLRVPVTR